MSSKPASVDKVLQEFEWRIDATLDINRVEDAKIRYGKGYRTARENLDDICDPDSFIEYGQFAVAAQRARLSNEELIKKTAADGVITGLATINSAEFNERK